MVKTNQTGGIGPKTLSSKKRPNTPKKTTTNNNNTKRKGTSNITPKITFPKTHQLIFLLFPQSTPMQLLKTNDNSKGTKLVIVAKLFFCQWVLVPIHKTSLWISFSMSHIYTIASNFFIWHSKQWQRSNK
jgi:hypothetical protein